MPSERTVNSWNISWIGGNMSFYCQLLRTGTSPPEQISSVARQRGIKLVLMDADHSVADRYEAQTTPHVFIADEFGLLRYRGAFDDVAFRQREATQFYVKNAVDALLNGNMPNPSDTKPFGCTIVRFA